MANKYQHKEGEKFRLGKDLYGLYAKKRVQIRERVCVK